MIDQIQTRADVASHLVADYVRLRVPSKLECIEPTLDYLKSRMEGVRACSPGQSHRMMVCLHEALTNAIVHGNLGISSALKDSGTSMFVRAIAERSSDPTLSNKMVDIEASFDGKIWQWRIQDEGEGFNVKSQMEKLKERMNEDDPERALCHGRGMLMMKSLMDSCEFDQGGKRCTLRLRTLNEERCEERHDASIPVNIIPVQDGHAEWENASRSIAVNVSESGIGLLKRGDVPVRQLLVEMEHEGKKIYVPAEVCHMQMRDDSLIQFGCRFTQVKDFDQSPNVSNSKQVAHAIESLISQLQNQALPSDDRRIHKRVRYHEKIQISITGMEPQFVFARDLSMGGMAFLATTKLPLEHARIELRIPNSNDIVFVDAQIVRSSEISQDIYDCGVSFDYH